MSNRNPLDYTINKPITGSFNPFLYIVKDSILFLSLSLILSFGLFMLYSASGQSLNMVFRQLTYIFGGLILMMVIAHLRPSSYKNLLMHSYWLGIFLLVYVLIFPAKGYETSRWIDLGFFSFQPSEIIRLILPLSLVAYLCRTEKKPQLSDWLQTSVASVICAYLVYKQPDLGTAIIVLTSGLIPVYLAGLPTRIIMSYLGIATIASPFIWSSLRDYQKQRVLTFLDPDVDPLGTGWNIAQSQTAIGSGGIYGKGYLEGTQSQLDFIPESHSDFIFSVIGEEFGLLGITLLFIVYGIVIWRIFKIGFSSETTFERLACCSLGFIFLLFILINVLMVIGIIPVVGVPLPLISQGGTSIVVHLMAFGVILSTKKSRL
ncbi:MAG: rod shape-determining protein RodA [Gammaproteobacteria bacterium]|nr:MAG: rod shape-determining protein RodA [Gammaproteobacteria bacterium]